MERTNERRRRDDDLFDWFTIRFIIFRRFHQFLFRENTRVLSIMITTDF